MGILQDNVEDSTYNYSRNRVLSSGTMKDISGQSCYSQLTDVSTCQLLRSFSTPAAAYTSLRLSSRTDVAGDYNPVRCSENLRVPPFSIKRSTSSSMLLNEVHNDVVNFDLVFRMSARYGESVPSSGLKGKGLATEDPTTVDFYPTVSSSRTFAGMVLIGEIRRASYQL
eukprot:1101312-Pyramimonas_sp.AAC.1